MGIPSAHRMKRAEKRVLCTSMAAACGGSRLRRLRPVASGPGPRERLLETPPPIILLALRQRLPLLVGHLLAVQDPPVGLIEALLLGELGLAAPP
eukprot:10992956-Lingulodinium_polyedra.AAC.1